MLLNWLRLEPRGGSPEDAAKKFSIFFTIFRIIHVNSYIFILLGRLFLFCNFLHFVLFFALEEIIIDM